MSPQSLLDVKAAIDGRRRPAAVKKSRPAASPAQYVASLRGWQAATVRRLRAACAPLRSSRKTIKWGNLVYFANGPVVVIRASAARAVRLVARAAAGHDRAAPQAGRQVRDGDAADEASTILPATIRKLVRKAVSLNRTIGDPTRAARG